MSKYEKLWDFVRAGGQDKLVLSYAQIKDICSFDIDHSFLTYKKELKDYGYEAGKISMKEKTVTFLKLERAIL